MSKKAPLEDEFREWLLRRKLLSQSTVQNHLVRLRRLIADYGLQGTLFTVILDKRNRLTQRYYKEFLAEHFSHIILPLLRSEERERNATSAEESPRPPSESQSGRTR